MINLELLEEGDELFLDLLNDLPVSIDIQDMSPSMSLDLMISEPLSLDLVSGGIVGDPGVPGGQDIDYLCAEIMAAHKAVSLNQDDMVVYTDIADVFLCKTFIGVTLNAGEVGHTVKVRKFGKISDVSLNFDPGQNIFVTSVGSLVSTKPVSSRYLCVGSSYDLNSFYLAAPLLWEEEV